MWLMKYIGLCQCHVMFSDILSRRYYVKAHNQHRIDHKRKSANGHVKAYVQYPNGISHPKSATTSYDLILGYPDWVHLTRKGNDFFCKNLAFCMSDEDPFWPTSTLRTV